MENKEIEEINFSEMLFNRDERLLSYIEQLEKELKEEQEENYKQSEWLVKKQKKIEQLETDYKEANDSITWWQNRFNAVKRDNKNLQKKAELGEHYKHLYSEVKKQKDDVVEYIKEHLTDNGRFLMLNEWQVPDLLRMLGEIE